MLCNLIGLVTDTLVQTIVVMRSPQTSITDHYEQRRVLGSTRRDRSLEI
jgi:hypothetical protein